MYRRRRETFCLEDKIAAQEQNKCLLYPLQYHNQLYLVILMRWVLKCCVNFPYVLML